MNYEKIYNKLINSRKQLKRSKQEDYFESHHILPASWGGNNENDNLVLLTAKEHWVAHLLLAKFAIGQNKYKAHQAVVNMGRVINSSKRKTSKLYENARKEISKEVSKRHNGTLVVKDVITGKMIGRVSKDHPNVLSGQWAFFQKGMSRSKEYRENKKLETVGENNGRYSGISDNEIVNYGLELFHLVGEISSINDLRIYVNKKYDVNIPKHFSEFRFPDKNYYEIIEEKTESCYNQYKRGEKLKSYQQKFKEILNAAN